MFGKNAKVDLELNRDVERLIKSGGKEQILPIVQAGEPVLRQQTVAYNGQLPSARLPNSSTPCTPPCSKRLEWAWPPRRSGSDWRLP